MDERPLAFTSLFFSFFPSFLSCWNQIKAKVQKIITVVLQLILVGHKMVSELITDSSLLQSLIIIAFIFCGSGMYAYIFFIGYSSFGFGHAWLDFFFFFSGLDLSFCLELELYQAKKALQIMCFGIDDIIPDFLFRCEKPQIRKQLWLPGLAGDSSKP